MIKSTVALQWHGEEVKIRAKAATKKSAFEIGLIVEGQAKLMAPVRTGRLAGSYTTASADRHSSPEAPAGASDVIKAPGDPMEVLVGTAVEYGPYMEFGTVRTDARPHLRPALDLAKGKALTIVQNNGRFELKEYMKE